VLHRSSYADFVEPAQKDEEIPYPQNQSARNGRGAEDSNQSDRKGTDVPGLVISSVITRPDIQMQVTENKEYAR
jgi:hypothetical protein